MSFKTEIEPTSEQKTKINKTIGTCRYVYNFFIAHNKRFMNKRKNLFQVMILLNGSIMITFLTILNFYG